MSIELARKVLEIRPRTPILLMSGYVTDAFVKTAQSAGARHGLEKPDGVAPLTEAIVATMRDSGPTEGL